MMETTRDAANAAEVNILRAMLLIAGDDQPMRRRIVFLARACAGLALLLAAWCGWRLYDTEGNGGITSALAALAGLGAGLAVHFQLTLLKWPHVQRHLSAASIRARLAELEGRG